MYRYCLMIFKYSLCFFFYLKVTYLSCFLLYSLYIFWDTQHEPSAARERDANHIYVPKTILNDFIFLKKAYIIELVYFFYFETIYIWNISKRTRCWGPSIFGCVLWDCYACPVQFRSHILKQKTQSNLIFGEP